jgi:hypothetical protein
MTLSLIGLATEIQLAIADVLVHSSGGHHAIHDWSSTCSFYRALLAPYVFETVSLRNDEESTTTVLRIARGPYREHVKNLFFAGFASGFVSEFECDYLHGLVGYGFLKSQTIHDVFSQILYKILSGLQQFPRLDSMSIRFAVDVFHWMDFVRDRGSRRLLTSMEEVMAAEASEVGRSLMKKTYKSLSKNIDHRITALELRDLQCVEVSAFHSQAFHRFLNSIQKFRLWFGFESAWHVLGYKNHLKFLSRLGIFFFDHLHNVLELHLKAREVGPIG